MMERIDMSNSQNNTHIESRVASLETSVNALTSDINSLVISINDLRNTMVNGQKTQWPTIISALAVLLALISAIGSSYITPINVAVSYHDRLLVERGQTINLLQDRLREVETRLVADEQTLNTKLEYIKENLTDVKINGSNKTRERLAVIETTLNIKDKTADKSE